MKRATGYFDGACEPNPGQMSYGAILYDERQAALGDRYDLAGHGTCNIAEWQGLIALLELAIECGVSDLKVCGDSKLVIMQATGRWRVKAQHLLPYKQKCDDLVRVVGQVTFQWIPRYRNTEADHLTRLAYLLGDRARVVVPALRANLSSGHFIEMV